jgi:hypothetical protein
MSATVYSLSNLNQYVNYFESMVGEASFLNFFAYTKATFDKASSDPNRSGWCFILEPFEAGIKDNGADSVLSYNTGMFVIAKKKTDQFKPYEIEQIAQVLAHKILGRMRRDQRERIIECKFDNISLDFINPMTSAEYYGVAVTFEYYYPINKDMKYDDGDWRGNDPENSFDYNFDFNLG